MLAMSSTAAARRASKAVQNGKMLAALAGWGPGSERHFHAGVVVGAAPRRFKVAMDGGSGGSKIPCTGGSKIPPTAKAPTSVQSLSVVDSESEDRARRSGRSSSESEISTTSTASADTTTVGLGGGRRSARRRASSEISSWRMAAIPKMAQRPGGSWSAVTT